MDFQRLQKKVLAYFKRLCLLTIASVRVLIHCLFHPEKLYMLLFSFYSTINAFYQNSHGHLRNFAGTLTFQQIKDKSIFARCNYFSSDLDIAYPVETQILGVLVAYFKPKKIFDIGTYNGFTTLHFAYNTDDDAVIYTLDLPPDFIASTKEKMAKYAYDDLMAVDLSTRNINKRMYKNDPQGAKIRELFGDSMAFDFTPFHGKMDLIFIDGNHSYPYVRSDTENAFKMLAKGGVIIWHDFDYIIHRDIFKYLNHLSEKQKIYSIPNTRFAIYSEKIEDPSF